MLAKKIPTCSSAEDARRKAIEFGSADEREWLDTFFRPRGGPPALPYYMPASQEWVQERYPDRALQRRRKDFEGSVFFHPSERRWALRATAAEELKRSVLGSRPPIPLVALMAWMWRDREITNLNLALKEFIRLYGLDRDKLVGTIYSAEIPRKFRDAGVADRPLNDSDISDLIGAAPPPPELPDLPKLVERIETHLTKRNTILVPGLVRRILGGWLAGDIVVLLGPPGSGKTFLATGLADALEEILGADRFIATFIEVNRDFDLAQFLGYENLAGNFTAGRFASEVLFVGQATDPRLVVLDEWNLAQIDSYFAPILQVIETGRSLSIPGKLDTTEEQRRLHPDLKDGKASLPTDTFFLATCNSWADEPESRLAVSGPVKRRCRIISLPNALYERYAREGIDGLRAACSALLTAERRQLDSRIGASRPSVFDIYRSTRLKPSPSFADLPDLLQQKLLAIARLLLENVATRNAFTVGLLRDILVSCAYSEPGQEIAALGEQVADKVIHQIQGDTDSLESLTQLCRDLPNNQEIEDLVRRMGAFGTDRQVRPLV